MFPCTSFSKSQRGKTICVRRAHSTHTYGHGVGTYMLRGNITSTRGSVEQILPSGDEQVLALEVMCVSGGVSPHLCSGFTVSKDFVLVWLWVRPVDRKQRCSAPLLEHHFRSKTCGGKKLCSAWEDGLSNGRKQSWV